MTLPQTKRVIWSTCDFPTRKHNVLCYRLVIYAVKHVQQVSVCKSGQAAGEQEHFPAIKKHLVRFVTCGSSVRGVG